MHRLRARLASSSGGVRNARSSYPIGSARLEVIGQRMRECLDGLHSAGQALDVGAEDSDDEAVKSDLNTWLELMANLDGMFASERFKGWQRHAQALAPVAAEALEFWLLVLEDQENLGEQGSSGGRSRKGSSSSGGSSSSDDGREQTEAILYSALVCPCLFLLSHCCRRTGHHGWDSLLRYLRLSLRALRLAAAVEPIEQPATELTGHATALLYSVCEAVDKGVGHAGVDRVSNMWTVVLEIERAVRCLRPDRARGSSSSSNMSGSPCTVLLAAALQFAVERLEYHLKAAEDVPPVRRSQAVMLTLSSASTLSKLALVASGDAAAHSAAVKVAREVNGAFAVGRTAVIVVRPAEAAAAAINVTEHLAWGALSGRSTLDDRQRCLAALLLLQCVNRLAMAAVVPDSNVPAAMPGVTAVYRAMLSAAADGMLCCSWLIGRVSRGDLANKTATEQQGNEIDVGLLRDNAMVIQSAHMCLASAGTSPWSVLHRLLEAYRVRIMGGLDRALAAVAEAAAASSPSPSPSSAPEPAGGGGTQGRGWHRAAVALSAAELARWPGSSWCANARCCSLAGEWDMEMPTRACRGGCGGCGGRGGGRIRFCSVACLKQAWLDQRHRDLCTRGGRQLEKTSSVE